MEEDTTVQEGARMVQLTIVKTGFNSRDITVKFATLDGDAVGKTSVSLYTSIKK